MLATVDGESFFKATRKSSLNIQFLRKQSNGESEYYILHDFDVGIFPEIGDQIINKSDNFLVKCHNTGLFHTFHNRSVVESFCVTVPGAEIVWDRNRPVFIGCAVAACGSKPFVKLDDIPDADPKDVDAFFGEMAQGVNCDAVELADSEFVNLLETLTHKKLSETHKNILFKVLNSNI